MLPRATQYELCHENAKKSIGISSVRSTNWLKNVKGAHYWLTVSEKNSHNQQFLHKQRSSTWRFSTTDYRSSHVTMQQDMMTSSNGSIFRVTGPLWRESTGHRWISLTKVSNAELWCCFSCADEQTAEKTDAMLLIWDAHGAHCDVTEIISHLVW